MESTADDGGKSKASRCGAGKKNGDGICGQGAGWGTDHPGFGRCKLHGGQSANGRKFGATLQAHAIAEQLFGGSKVPVAPGAVLLDELARANAMVLFLEQKLQGWQVIDRDAVPESLEYLSDPDDRMNALINDVPLVGKFKVTQYQRTGLPPMGVAMPGAGGGITVHPSEYQAVLNWYMSERQQAMRVAKLCFDVGVQVEVIDAIRGMRHSIVAMALFMAEQLGVGREDPRMAALVQGAVSAARQAIQSAAA